MFKLILRIINFILNKKEAQIEEKKEIKIDKEELKRLQKQFEDINQEIIQNISSSKSISKEFQVRRELEKKIKELQCKNIC
jgi:CBS domain containing-hemolysin-like protein